MLLSANVVATNFEKFGTRCFSIMSVVLPSGEFKFRWRQIDGNMSASIYNSNLMTTRVDNLSSTIISMLPANCRQLVGNLSPSVHLHNSTLPSTWRQNAYSWMLRMLTICQQNVLYSFVQYYCKNYVCSTIRRMSGRVNRKLHKNL